MKKAYDSMEWNFIIKIMRHLGFFKQFCNLILSCLNSITYSLLLNGIPFGNIIPQRILRQGNPISTYLFIAKTLSGHLIKAEHSSILMIL